MRKPESFSITHSILGHPETRLRRSAAAFPRLAYSPCFTITTNILLDFALSQGLKMMLPGSTPELDAMCFQMAVATSIR